MAYREFHVYPVANDCSRYSCVYMNESCGCTIQDILDKDWNIYHATELSETYQWQPLSNTYEVCNWSSCPEECAICLYNVSSNPWTPPEETPCVSKFYNCWQEYNICDEKNNTYTLSTEELTNDFAQSVVDAWLDWKEPIISLKHDKYFLCWANDNHLYYVWIDNHRCNSCWYTHHYSCSIDICYCWNVATWISWGTSCTVNVVQPDKVYNPVFIPTSPWHPVTCQYLTNFIWNWDNGLAFKTDDYCYTRWPAKDWYHIPTTGEWNTVSSILNQIWLWTVECIPTALWYLHLPFAWCLNWSWWNPIHWEWAQYWSSTTKDKKCWYATSINNQAACYAWWVWKATALPIREFSDYWYTDLSALANFRVYDWSACAWEGAWIYYVPEPYCDVVLVWCNWSQIVMADRNIWAIDKWCTWCDLTAFNVWSFFQRWNNYWFPYDWCCNHNFKSTTDLVYLNDCVWCMNNFPPYCCDVFVKSSWTWLCCCNNWLWWCWRMNNKCDRVLTSTIYKTYWRGEQNRDMNVDERKNFGDELYSYFREVWTWYPFISYCNKIYNYRCFGYSDNCLYIDYISENYNVCTKDCVTNVPSWDIIRYYYDCNWNYTKFCPSWEYVWREYIRNWYPRWSIPSASCPDTYKNEVAQCVLTAINRYWDKPMQIQYGWYNYDRSLSYFNCNGCRVYKFVRRDASTSNYNSWYSQTCFPMIYLYACCEDSQLKLCCACWSWWVMYTSPRTIATNINYTCAFMPTVPWQPATKQYVDCCIAAAGWPDRTFHTLTLTADTYDISSLNSCIVNPTDSFTLSNSCYREWETYILRVETQWTCPSISLWNCVANPYNVSMQLCPYSLHQFVLLWNNNCIEFLP